MPFFDNLYFVVLVHGKWHASASSRLLDWSKVVAIFVEGCNSSHLLSFVCSFTGSNSGATIVSRKHTYFVFGSQLHHPSLLFIKLQSRNFKKSLRVWAKHEILLNVDSFLQSFSRGQLTVSTISTLSASYQRPSQLAKIHLVVESKSEPFPHKHLKDSA